MAKVATVHSGFVEKSWVHTCKGFLPAGRRVCLLLLICLFLPLAAFAQPSWQWARGAMPALGSDYANCIGTDSMGNVYVAGSGYAGITFGGPDTLAAGMFLVKYSPDGNVAWAKQFNCYAAALTTDPAGNSYVTGNFSGTLQMGTNMLIGKGQTDLFVAKIDANGDVVWARQAGGPNILTMPMTGEIEDRSFAIAADAAGNCYVSAAVLTSDTAAATFDSVPVYTDTPTLLRKTVCVLAKYNAAGTILWVQKVNGNGAMGVPAAIAVTGQGECVVAGTFSGTLTLGTTTLTSNGNSDFYYAATDSSGAILWARSFGSPDYDSGDAIAVNLQGEIYVAGSIWGTVQSPAFTLSGANQRLYVLKCDSNGNVLWANQATGPGYSHLPRLAVDASGSCYAGARYSGAITVGQQTFTETTSGENPLVIKWNTSGDLEWAASAFGYGWDWINGIAVSANQQGCFIYGHFENDLHFGANSLQANQPGGFFLAKLTNLVTGRPAEIPETDWSVYPNPTSGLLHLKLPLTAQPAKAVLTDVCGQEVFASILPSATEATLELPKLAAGIYVLSIQTGKEVLRKKIVIQ